MRPCRGATSTACRQIERPASQAPAPSMDLSRLLPRFVILLGSSHFTWRRYRGSARRQPRRHLLDAGQTSVVLDPERGDRVLVRVTDVEVFAVRAQSRAGRAVRGLMLAVDQDEVPDGLDRVAPDRTVVPEASRVSVAAVISGDDPSKCRTARCVPSGSRARAYRRARLRKMMQRLPGRELPRDSRS